MTTEPEPLWAQMIRDFGAPHSALRAASERTGVGSEALLAVARDIRAIRAVLDLACQVGTIVGYSMGHPPVQAPGGVVMDEEACWNRSLLGEPPTFHREARTLAEPNLSDPDETVTP